VTVNNEVKKDMNKYLSLEYNPRTRVYVKKDYYLELKQWMDDNGLWNNI